MLNQAQRITVARSAVDYITGRDEAEMRQPVPNCPGWTVYNAAVHVGRTSVFWERMMACPPDDTTARDRALAHINELPSGADPDQLAAWGHSVLDVCSGDPETECFFSMTGGPGNLGLWAWHAASEIGIHRLDVEAALQQPYSITHEQAVDSIHYAAQYFLPAFRRASGEDPGCVNMEIHSGFDSVSDVVVLESESESVVTVAGEAVDVLLAMWGRPHGELEVVNGSGEVLDQWRALPASVYQFGTWD